MKRRNPNACINCGRSDWVDSVDNHGAHYLGCAHCRIVIPPAITLDAPPPEPAKPRGGKETA